MSREESTLPRRMQWLGEQIEELRHSAGPDIQEKVRQMLQTLLDFHGTGLARLRERIAQAGEPGRDVWETCARDELVGSLLLLHGLHPWDLSTRLRHALDTLRPWLQAQGAEVRLLSATEETVRLRLLGRAGVSVPTLRSAVEEAVSAAVPEVGRIEVEASSKPSSGLLPLPLLAEPK